MFISDVVTLEDGTTTKGHIKRGEKAFFGIRLKEGDMLCLTLQMKGDITAKIFFQNKRNLIKTMRSGNHAIRFTAPCEGFYQCTFETIEGANYTLGCKGGELKEEKEVDGAPPMLKNISLKNLLVLIPLFIMPALVFFLLLGKWSSLLTLLLFLAVYLFHERTDEKGMMLNIIYSCNAIFTLLVLFHVYFIEGWHDGPRLLLVSIYLSALLLVLATFHLFLRKTLGYGK